MPKKINKPRHGRVKIIVVGNQHGKAVLFERLQAALEQTMGASVPPWGLLAGRKIGRSFVEDHKLLAVRGYGDVVYNIPPDAIKSLISAPAPKEAALVHCHICGKLIDPDTAVASGYNGDLCCQDHFSASAEEVEAVTEDQATIADLQDRLALAEQKYLDEKSRRVKHGKRANELHNQNAELQRKNLALNAQKRDAVPPIDLWALLYIARADTTKVDAETIRDFLSAGLIAEGDTFASYHLTGRGKYLVSKYCNVTSMGAPDTEKDNLRREVLKLVGEAAGARLELEEVRARLDEIRNIILARSIRMKLSGDTFAVEMNGLNYGTLIHALDGTGKFAPQS